MACRWPTSPADCVKSPGGRWAGDKLGEETGARRPRRWEGSCVRGRRASMAGGVCGDRRGRDGARARFPHSFWRVGSPMGGRKAALSGRSFASLKLKSDSKRSATGVTKTVTSRRRWEAVRGIDLSVTRRWAQGLSQGAHTRHFISPHVFPIYRAEATGTRWWGREPQVPCSLLSPVSLGSSSPGVLVVSAARCGSGPPATSQRPETLCVPGDTGQRA